MDEKLKTGQAECTAQNQIELKCTARKRLNGADVGGLSTGGQAEGISSCHRPSL